MRRFTKVSAAVAASALILAGCGSNADDDGGDDTSSGGSGSGGDGGSSESTDLMIGVAYDVGGRGDYSFNDAAYAGVQKAVNEYGADSEEGEAAADEDETTRENRLRDFAEDGANVIIGVGFAYSESVDAVAPDFPDVSFAVIDGFDPTDDDPNDNVAYLTFAENQGSFLVGAAAALTSKSGQVGFVGGVNNALIQKFEAGYVAGVKAAKPNTKVDIKYIEQTNLSGFADPSGGKAAAGSMYDSGADVVYHAAGASGSGVFDAAKEAGKGNWAIGVDSDQYKSVSADLKPFILTSMIKRVDVATYDFITSVKDGKPLSGYQTFDLKADGVGYSTSGNFLSKQIINQLETYKKQIISGKIKVPEKP